MCSHETGRANVSFFILILFSVSLTYGCASRQIVHRSASEISKQEYKSATQESTTEFDSTIKYVGPLLRIDNTDYRIRSWKQKKDRKTITHQIYASIRYVANNWRFYHSAQSEDAQSFDLTRISREVNACFASTGSCSYTEIYGIVISSEFLKSKEETGFRIRLSSPRGNTIINFPSQYVSAYLESVGVHSQKSQMQDTAIGKKSAKAEVARRQVRAKEISPSNNLYGCWRPARGKTTRLVYKEDQMILLENGTRVAIRYEVQGREIVVHLLSGPPGLKGGVQVLSNFGPQEFDQIRIYDPRTGWRTTSNKYERCS